MCVFDIKLKDHEKLSRNFLPSQGKEEMYDLLSFASSYDLAY